MPPTSTHTPPRLLNTREVAEYCNVHRATIDRGVAAGTFPKPLMMGPRSPRWSELVVAEHFAARSAA